MIKLENVSKIYKGDIAALRDVTAEVQKGEFLFLVGPSGSGKSTFLRLLLREDIPTRGTITIADLNVAKLPRRRVPQLRQRIGCVFQDFRLLNKEEEPSDGRIYVAGKDIAQLNSWKVPYLRRNIGCVFQDFKLLPNRTAYENVAFALEVIGRPSHVIKSQVPQVLDLVGLSKKHDNFPHEMSGGEQQRVSIARAFVNRPLILLADEPTGNLDPATSVGIMRLLDRINRTGTTVVMATHDRSIVDTMQRRVIELDQGEIVRDQVRGVYQ